MNDRPPSAPRTRRWLADAMASRWAHQLVALVFYLMIAIAFHRWGSANLPPWRLIAGDAAYATALIVWSGAFLVYRRRVKADIAHDIAWQDYLLVTLWAMSLMSVILFWLQAAYANPDRRIISILVVSVLISASAITTVRPPDQGRKTLSETILPMVVPGGIVLYFLVFLDGRLSLITGLLCVYCALMLALREFLQRQLNAAHSATLAAQAQRDAQIGAKARFLAAASHDLDQPLQSAQLFFDQVRRSDDPVTRDRAADRLEWAMDSMTGMIRQVTQHLQLDAGAVAAKREAVPIGPILSRCLERNEHAAGLAGVELRTLPVSLAALGDAVLIERVIGNFLGNAIRHARAKRILTGARRAGGRVRIWVIDDGRGIPQADRETLFDDYTQGSDHQGEVRGGFGLGLGSARRMATLMDGTTGLDPRWDPGSAFFLELPAT